QEFFQYPYGQFRKTGRKTATEGTKKDSVDTYRQKEEGGRITSLPDFLHPENEVGVLCLCRRSLTCGYESPALQAEVAVLCLLSELKIGGAKDKIFITASQRLAE
ncbi:MAG: hypothetical protein LBS46_02220, partial [Dysgonamonadaceae bacterium]|nr:hypothetical protein [Dysgonamonadaceae bacterium]